MDDLSEESRAFDAHALERIRHGVVPDLRRAVPVDWFYNNVWRRPYLVNLECGRNLEFALAHVTDGRVLEVGSGMGHMALELARHGLQVTGLELSPAAVAVAKRFAAENPFRDGFGSLEYVSADILTWQPAAPYDAVCFFNTLHHFVDVDAILARVESLLKPGGALVVVEPARDWLTEREATVVALLRLVLAARDSWYEPLPLPRTEGELAAYVHECHREYAEARDRHDDAQSPHDNAAYADAMIGALRARFRESTLENGGSLYYKVSPGVRGQSESDAKSLAEFIHLVDRFAVDRGFLNAGEFLWAGRRR